MLVIDYVYVSKCPCISEIYMEILKNKGSTSSTYTQMI